YGEYLAEGELIMGVDTRPEALLGIVTRSGINAMPYRPSDALEAGTFVAGASKRAYRVVKAGAGPVGPAPSWPTQGDVEQGGYHYADKGPSAEVAYVGLVRTGRGTPEGVVSAPVGSLYTRTDGTPGKTLYVKEKGDGPTGWVAK